jgi:hypothetical protein
MKVEGWKEHDHRRFQVCLVVALVKCCETINYFGKDICENLHRRFPETNGVFYGTLNLHIKFHDGETCSSHDPMSPLFVFHT